MRSEKLPISTLPVWAELNNVTSSSIQVAPIVDGKGLGLISSAEILKGNEVLVTVPQDLVLSLERVWVLAKSDTHLREVLESVGEYSRVACPSASLKEEESLVLGADTF